MKYGIPSRQKSFYQDYIDAKHMFDDNTVDFNIENCPSMHKRVCDCAKQYIRILQYVGFDIKMSSSSNFSFGERFIKRCDIIYVQYITLVINYIIDNGTYVNLKYDIVLIEKTDHTPHISELPKIHITKVIEGASINELVSELYQYTMEQFLSEQINQMW